MTLEEVAKFCQRQLETVPLLIIGSGASAAHGLPTMGALAQHLIDHLNYPAGSEEYEQWEEFKQQLRQEWDLEKALNIVTVNSRVLDDIIVNTWNCINEADLNVYYDLVSRKIELPLAKLIRWLMAKANPKLSIITTNYDKLVEYSAGLNKSNIYTGFANSVFGNLNAGRSHATSLKCEGLEGQIDIWKVHGSLDWFKTNCSSIQSLQINDLTKAQVKPLIVTPGVSKYYETHKDPFRTIMTNSDREINKAKSFFCIGYGFNDEHIQPQLIDRVRRKGIPLILITKQLTQACRNLFLSGDYKDFLLIEESKDNVNNSTVYSQSNLHGTNCEAGIWQLDVFLQTILSV